CGPKAYARPRVSVARRTPAGAAQSSRAAGESALHLRPEGFALVFGCGDRRLGRSRRRRRGRRGRRRCPERGRLLVGTTLLPSRAFSSTPASTTSAAATTALPVLSVSPGCVVASRTTPTPAPAATTSPAAAPTAPPPLPSILLDGRLGRCLRARGLVGERASRDQLDARLEVRIHLYDADLWDLGRRGPGPPGATAKAGTARRHAPA